MKFLALLFAFSSFCAYAAYDVTFEWDAPADVTNVEGYRLYQQDGATQLFHWVGSASVPTQTLGVTALNEKIQYAFYVTSFNSLYESDPSNVVYYIAQPRLKMGNIGLEVSAKAGNNYILYQSTDLKTWTYVGGVRAPSDHFTIPVQFSEAAMFFKLEIL